MAALAVAGVPLPVVIDSLRVGHEQVGTAVRTANGVRIVDRRALKRIVEFDLAPKGVDEGMMYRHLLSGEGDYWTAKTDKEGSKGAPLTGTAPWSSSSTPFWGSGGISVAAGQTMIVPFTGWPNEAGRQWGGTLIALRFATNYFAVGLSWKGLGTGADVKRQRQSATLTPAGFGSLAAYSGPESFGVAPGAALTITGSGATAFWGSMMFLPRYFPQAQVDALIDGWTTHLGYLPALPAVAVEMDLFPSSLTSGTPATYWTAHGEVKDEQLTPHWRAGAFDKSAFSLNAQLVEV